MDEFTGVLAILMAFLVPGGIIYYLLRTRHNEQMAMIDKGLDVSAQELRRNSVPYRLGTTAIGVGIGLVVALLIESSMTAIDDEVLYPALVFIFGGLGLLISGKVASRMTS